MFGIQSLVRVAMFSFSLRECERFVKVVFVIFCYTPKFSLASAAFKSNDLKKKKFIIL